MTKHWERFLVVALLALPFSCAEVPAEEQLKRALKLKECLGIVVECRRQGDAANGDGVALLDALGKCTEEINKAGCAQVLYDGVEGITRK